jgi:hypothetical protein
MRKFFRELADPPVIYLDIELIPCEDRKLFRCLSDGVRLQENRWLKASIPTRFQTVNVTYPHILPFYYGYVTDECCALARLIL